MRIPFLSRRQPTVAVIRLSGVIAAGGRGRGSINLLTLSRVLQRAFSVRGVRAIALDINSPGGSPVQSAMVFDRIRALAEEKKLPVLGFTQDVAASGGYWLACAADEIFANENSIVGSVGVISSSFGLQGLLDRFGIERRVHTSGDRKGFLDPFLPERTEDVARLKSLQAEIHESFRELVRERRRGRLKADEEVLFSGEFWTGRKAMELGLVDGLGDLRTVLRERYGKKVRLPVFGPEQGWLRRRIGIAGWSGTSGTHWADELMNTIEARAIWSRYGL
ncbi:MAG: S49 family peptidase [Rhodospirillaceae bacterium]|nr:S49 family peptidase [Rhodospirillaceae bacterium]